MPAQYPQYLDNDPLATGRELLDRLPSRLTLEQFNELYWFVGREALNHGYYLSRKEDTTESSRSRRDKKIAKNSKAQELEDRIDKLRSQSRLCQTSQGAAIIAAIAEWMRGNCIVEGNLEPWQFVDKWVGQVEPIHEPPQKPPQQQSQSLPSPLATDANAIHSSSVPDSSDLATHCEQAAAIVATWPEWKRGVLGYSSQPTRQEPRQPVDNSRESVEKLNQQESAQPTPSPLANCAADIRAQLLSLEFLAAFAKAFAVEFVRTPFPSTIEAVFGTAAALSANPIIDTPLNTQLHTEQFATP